MRKLIFLFFLLAFWLIPVQTAQAVEQTGLDLDCIGAVLMDGSSGEILYEQNSDQQCYPASVTKIMTMALILEAVNSGHISLDDEVTVSEYAAAMGGSQVYLYTGETRTVDEMMIAIAVGSGNDAAYAMAEFVGGTYAKFIEMMNQKAAELGMTNTHFVNPHGLHDPDHYTTAGDLAKLAYYAIKIPLFLDYTAIYEYEFRPEPKQLVLWNTNRLLKWYEGTDGIKTGYTVEAGRNLVATVVRDNMRLISVVVGCAERQGHFKESMNLLNYGYNTYRHTVLHQAGEVIAYAEVGKGKQDQVALTAREDIGYTAQKSSEPTISERQEIISILPAPIKAGDVAGKLEIYKDGELLQCVDLVAAEDVAKGGLFRTWGKLLKTMW